MIVDPRFAQFWRRVPPKLPYQIVEALMIVLLAGIVARLGWIMITPFGPVGNWKAGGATRVIADETLLTTFDPFFRNGAVAGPAVVTSLAIKLFGVRVDLAMGRGSAIIATPDGLQSSFAVGDEIMPGVKLKAVTFEGVTIDRGGVDEQVFLDQSVAASVAAPGTSVPSANGAGGASALANEISFEPRTANGQVTGFIISPKGSGAAFRAAGLQEGDILTAVNGQGIRTAEDVTNAIAATPATGVAMLSIERSGRTITLSTRAKP